MTKPYNAPQTKVNKGGASSKNTPHQHAPSKPPFASKPYSTPGKDGRPPETPTTNTPLGLQSHPEGDVPHYYISLCNYVSKKCCALHWPGERPASPRHAASHEAAFSSCCSNTKVILPKVLASTSFHHGRSFPNTWSQRQGTASIQAINDSDRPSVKLFQSTVDTTNGKNPLTILSWVAHVSHHKPGELFYFSGDVAHGNTD
ncbi:hypothetical protein L202_07004 [Cryptococcus amylolentus CBS 6039]|uniref:Uncharacterized protein n=2 Tax=Cryptococcus amylolentus TaxID=104669 RepID=A0A1E3HEB9_9TREE|nr:hypothetical protein L202_07004 [Cryptococcus amylolentus CBS 6039]ODN74664.1 hypothetical protein L202_07004 [Cryptococcus amylolentus CBS 6039]ODO01608.1 hypothetical protein I350_06428 [Cryptococcus amylolentus CBS 6273]